MTDVPAEVTDDEAIEAVPEPEPDPNAVAVTLNGREIIAHKGDLVIAVAESNGATVPHFCYHPRMSSVGMCRQCLVEVDTGRGMQLQPSQRFESPPFSPRSNRVNTAWTCWAVTGGACPRSRRMICTGSDPG